MMLALASLTVSCGSLPKESVEAQSRKPKQESQETVVDAAIAHANLLEPQPEYTGSTAPFRIISVRSQIEGRLLALNLDIGDTVNRGKIISQVDDILLLNTLKQAEAQLVTNKSELDRAKTQISNALAQVEKAKLELMQAESDYQRMYKLYKEGAISQQITEQAKTKAQTAKQSLKVTLQQVQTEKEAVTAAQGRVLAQKAVVKAAAERRSYARIISPITGTVIEKTTEPGNLIQPGSEILKIGDFSQVKIITQISELELAKIKIGQSVQVKLDAFPDQEIIGRVNRISPSADNTSRLIPVEIVIPNIENKIGSGLLARVKFTTSENKRVIIPITAINNQDQEITENSTSTVFIVQKRGEKTTVKQQAITIGKIANNKVEILSGLQPGDNYVVRSNQPLKNGKPVKLSMLSESSDKNN
ncbi:efflux RND transporter periplasmic adaptor subunit [Anabaena sp. FACHB-1237]|uniref:efflux RND transporter periplasmic adaptor subunit n=1 Tax=Anabaena sp. FACHB-1237 TaxID=2692769 RepID=UPI001F54A7CC|nr:efflux RND transporter periplasmic adaptor subunit [Anabaena sp. FACHB-1237]